MRRPTYSLSLPFTPVFFSRVNVGFFFILGILTLLCVACGAEPAANNTMPLDQALAVAPRDDRPEIMQQMGRPDAFRLRFETLNGQPVRYEEWSYFDDLTSLVLMDGTLTSTISIEPLPDGSIYASYYDPQSFRAGMTSSDVKTLLADQELYELPTDEIGQPGGLVMVGRQILFGFDQDRLVYVETLALTSEEVQ